MKDSIQINNTKDIDVEDEDDSKIFPQRLMAILSDELNQESICWLPHGNSFIVRNRKLFSETVMPRYFSRKAKYSSFTRKLNRWNFTRVSSGPELGSYHHEFFLRDKPHLAAQMFCKNARTMLAMTVTPSTSTPVGEKNIVESSVVQTESAITTTAVAPVTVAGTSEASVENVSQKAAVAAMPRETPLTSKRIPAPAAIRAVGNNSHGMNFKGNDQHAVLAALMSAKQTNVGQIVPQGHLNSLQLLERQMMVIAQQQEASRMIMAMRLGGNNHLQHQQPEVGVGVSNISTNQQQHLIQLRQLMELRRAQQDSRQPTINRASAA